MTVGRLCSFTRLAAGGAFLALCAAGYAQDGVGEAAAAAVTATQDAAAVVLSDAEKIAALEKSVADNKVLLDTIWVVVAACLVFLMQAGFAYVEGGFTRAKNANNIMMKNLMSVSIGTLAFMAIGFGVMFGTGNAFMGTSGFFMKGHADGVFSSLDWSSVDIYLKLFFQLMFAATAGTIVSGAVAERTKFSSYLVATVVTTALIYPIVGHWAWGGGWLGSLDPIFTDFAGSTVVHLTGGVMALCGILIVGPRKGKYGPDGKPRAIPGHSIPMAALGVFFLWMGWFGFNAGSTMGASADIGWIALNTNLGAAAGSVGAMFVALILFRTFDVGMILNGVLAGLVGVTAGCLAITPVGATIIGFLAGALVVFAVVLIDKFADDPVGAVSVHGVCGAFATIMVGFFAKDGGLLYGGGPALLIVQLKGVLATIAFVGVCGTLLFLALKYTMGLRVSAEEEFNGLDIGEHGLAAYPDPGFVGATQGGGGVMNARPAASVKSDAPATAGLTAQTETTA